ncbi:MAG TPA: class D sortase [Thermoanaerobaculaceae bacterium]|nr:class D sortase [Thermoanaerobaculaceae bacterium]HQU33728.1 class D sortase [Thermoanaerobaculaceae bacterium]
MRTNTRLAWLERGLLAVGLACLAWWAAGSAYARWASAGQNRRLDRLIAAGGSAPATRRPAPPQLGDPLGRVEISRVGVSTVIVEGDGELTLSYAAGHIPGTALPGEAGNATLAGHRDGVFRGLARIRRGDLISITTLSGKYHYAVDSLRVVKPDDVSVLRPTRRPTLTLVTCYPFRYIGPAPERFIVQARLVGSTSAAPRATWALRPDTGQRRGSKIPRSRFLRTLSQVKKRPFMAT